MRTVWASTAPFSPNSSVFFIAYDPNVTEDIEQWRGFTNK
jgi:hypothetical protein